MPVDAAVGAAVAAAALAAAADAAAAVAAAADAVRNERRPPPPSPQGPPLLPTIDPTPATEPQLPGGTLPDGVAGPFLCALRACDAPAAPAASTRGTNTSRRPMFAWPSISRWTRSKLRTAAMSFGKARSATPTGAATRPDAR